MKFVVLVFSFLLLVFSKSNLDSGIYAINLCLTSIIPSLFPFFVVSRLILDLGICHDISNKLANVSRKILGSKNSISVFILGIIAGYPVGTKNICHLYSTKNISKNKAHSLLLYCSNSGPAFIVSMAGVGIFSSATVGIKLYLIHIFSALFVGILINFIHKDYELEQDLPFKTKPFSIAIISAIKESMESCIAVSAFVIFFTVFLSCIPMFPSLLSGFIEIGGGLNAIKLSNMSKEGKLLLSSAVIAFGGVSVHFQSISFLMETDLKISRYLLGKCLHLASAVVFTLIFLNFF